MKKNIVPAILFVFMLLLAPVAAAQPGPVTAVETGTVEDLTPPATAAPVASPGPKGSPSLSSSLFPPSGLGILGGLGAIILVMTLLYLILKVLTRPRRFKSLKGRQSAFELRGIQPLDDTKYLAAVQIEGRLIVVGVTADRVTPVADWFAEEEAEESQPRMKFSPAYPGPDLGPSLDAKPMEDDNSPPDISIAEQGRYRDK